MISYISIVAIPLLIFIILLTGVVEKKEILTLFVQGAQEGLKTIYKIFPHVLAIMVAVSLFRETGAIDIVFYPIIKLLNNFNVSKEVLTLSILRPISGGASSAIVMDIFEKFGPDSVQGKIASILMGGTETTFYVITVLFGAVGIKRIRGTLIAALLADLTAIALSIIIVVNGIV